MRPRGSTSTSVACRSRRSPADAPGPRSQVRPVHRPPSIVPTSAPHFPRWQLNVVLALDLPVRKVSGRRPQLPGAIHGLRSCAVQMRRLQPLLRLSGVRAPRRRRRFGTNIDDRVYRALSPPVTLGMTSISDTRHHGRASRALLLDSGIARVENLRSPGEYARTSAEEHSAAFQVCLPYRGHFVWQVGADDVVGDANQVLYVRAGENFRLRQPCPGEYAELIITPAISLLAAIAGSAEAALTDHPLFRRRSQRARTNLLQQRTRMLHSATSMDACVVAVEERVIDMLRLSLETEPRAVPASRRTRRLIGRTKEYLEAHLSDAIRLTEVARVVGASPAYLTDLFRRVEGVPVHRYLTQLRLSRALVDLHHAADLSAFALSLGFSSHSHFTSSFRRAFGCTPSRFRESIRQNREHQL